MTTLAILVVFLPLIGGLLAGTFGWRLGDKFSQRITSGLLITSFVCAVFLSLDTVFAGHSFVYPLFTWIHLDFFSVDWGLQVDSLSVTMMLVVTLVSSMVHVYSIGYMHGDQGIPRFMAYLSLFTFFMLMLVTAPNFLQMFFGWEGVGLASYLLIGYWYERESANAASIKAFIVNRVGDVGFALGICTVIVIFGTSDFVSVFGMADEYINLNFNFLGFEVHALTIATLLLFIGAMGKSAQLGLHTWLPDAMEGPTPVSALIHAATMVTAGVFMIIRISPLLEYAPLTRDIILIVGALTSFFAATVACTQNDIKRIIAYSTCSQLGLMFVAAGVSAYGASMFHLTTHAFFKAMLFLGAGSVIHAMSDEQNIQKMGGIWKFIPITYVIMWIGNLALAGIPFFAGYFSKDIIVEAVWASANPLGQMIYVICIMGIVMTAFYSWRLLILTFHGKPRADEVVMGHIHESPMVMLVPLMVLAVGSVFGGYFLVESMVGEGSQAFWRNAIFVLSQNDSILAAHHHTPRWIELSPTVASLIGIGIAYLLYAYLTNVPDRLMNAMKSFYNFLYKKWYFDELYDSVFVKPSLRLGNILWKRGDGNLIDGYGPDGVAAISSRAGVLLCRLQTGYLYHYAFAMIVGLALIVGWHLWIF
ncbi:NADH-quinone oxidoreductase subunit L [Candidatus Bealeia paramacronuclearis]|uniref:NADH-ubiquinone oxidoreductase chain 5 n=1 Tax=Candidatus Bealeia paramacronuclearis TaxID=1921001 RepID=A0ABZ2C677_9PROT|nr:NADH-quinone oxidoreductase subunit L [Candidatus Bealeia paramacronuclearis]